MAIYPTAMEGGLASALFTTHHPQEEHSPLILATAFLLSGVMSVDVSVIYYTEVGLRLTPRQCISQAREVKGVLNGTHTHTCTHTKKSPWFGLEMCLRINIDEPLE